jgi:hypothetical protein
MMIRHWSMTNGSGMHHMAEAMALAERRLGLDSELIDCNNAEQWDGAEHADIHVLHTDVPESFRLRIQRAYKLVFVVHGTPEVVFETTIENFARPGYGMQDGWASLRHLVKTADAVVTFWPRHQAIYQSMVPKERHIHCVPMGVDTAFWAEGESAGKYAGQPSVWTSENQHRIKWVLDVLAAWPRVLEQVRSARLHAHYIPMPLHRFFIDFANSNGASSGAILSSAAFAHKDLRAIWKGLDFYLSPVRYGDHNTIAMQSRAAGLKTISYEGNLYADYWLREGDHRRMADDLANIFMGMVEPRADRLPVPDLKDMGQAMIAIYESIVDRSPVTIIEQPYGVTDGFHQAITLKPSRSKPKQKSTAKKRARR